MLNKTYVGKTSDLQLQLIDALESAYGQDSQKHFCRASVDENGHEYVRLKVYDETHNETSEFLMTCHKGTVDEGLGMSSDCVTLLDERISPNDEPVYYFDETNRSGCIFEIYYRNSNAKPMIYGIFVNKDSHKPLSMLFKDSNSHSHSNQTTYSTVSMTTS